MKNMIPYESQLILLLSDINLMVYCQYDRNDFYGPH